MYTDLDNAKYNANLLDCDVYGGYVILKVKLDTLYDSMNTKPPIIVDEGVFL